MRCRDAKQWLGAQRDGGLVPPDASVLQEHLKSCSECHAFEQDQRHLDSKLCTLAPRVHTSISTDNIMLAVQRQRRITEQLEDIRQQQQSRVKRLSPISTAVAAIAFFTLGSIPLLVLAITIIRVDLMVKTLSWLHGIIDVLFIVAPYLNEGLTTVTRNNWLLSGIALAVVIMTGMWLRLMRYPQET